MFVKATLKDGGSVVSQFSKLTGISKYANDVMAGRKGFNLWRVAATTHPVSGEKVLMRSQEVISGGQIEKLAIVRPMTLQEANAVLAVTQEALDAGIATLDPQFFVTEVQPQSAGYGTWRAPAGLEGVPEGTVFPVHRDGSYGEKYVVLKVDENGERKHFFERGPDLPGDGDEEPVESDRGHYDDTDDDIF